MNHPELYPVQKTLKECKLVAGDDYLQLSSGNYWKMDYGAKRTIDGKVKIGDKEYFVMQDGELKFFYRKENNKIMVKEFDDPVRVKFNFNVEVNSTWQFNKWNVALVSKTDTVFINDIFISNC